MRPQPASQTTINPPGKNPSSQPPPLGIAPNALRHVEGLKTPVTAATGTNVERGGLGSASTAQPASANGTSASGEWSQPLWYPSSCGHHSRVNRASSFLATDRHSFPYSLPHPEQGVAMWLLPLVSSLQTEPSRAPLDILVERLAGGAYYCPYNYWL